MTLDLDGGGLQKGLKCIGSLSFNHSDFVDCLSLKDSFGYVIETVVFHVMLKVVFVFNHWD